jgi:Orotate phosphoribosyltransferase
LLSFSTSLAVFKKTRAFLGGRFFLSSGLPSPLFVRCAEFLGLPKASDNFSLSLSKKIKKKVKKIDIILSPALGGLVVGYEIGRLKGKKQYFVGGWMV